jgi:transmembrane sensor
MSPGHAERERVAEDAALWVQRLASDRSAGNLAAFDRWIRERQEHVEEFLIAQVLESEMELLRADRAASGSEAPGKEGAVLEFPPEGGAPLKNAGDVALENPSVSSSGSAAGAAGASLAGLKPQRPAKASALRGKPVMAGLLVAAALALVVTGLQQLVLPAFRPSVYETEIGKFTAVTLEDNSVVALNTDSEIRVRYGWASRSVELVRGEAGFTVAHDARPFVVSANGVELRAVGTVFGVRRRSEGVTEVVVTRGQVVVERETPQVISQYEIATLDRGAVRVSGPDSREAVRRLAWIRGRIYFNNIPLSEAVAEISRYSRLKIDISELQNANIRVSGMLQVGRPEMLFEGLSRVAGVSVTYERDREGREIARLHPPLDENESHPAPD